MALEITKTELRRLKKHLASAKKRRNRHPLKTSREKEKRILSLINAGISNNEIKHIEQTSEDTINKIKKANGLWGA